MPMSTDNRAKIKAIVRSCQMIAAMGRSRPGTPPSHELYYKMLAGYYERLLMAEKEGRFIAAHTIFFPVEILYAMDMVPLHLELTAWMTALFSKSAGDYLTRAAEVGLAPEICSPYRVLAGALADEALPRPRAMLWTSLICDNASKGGELVGHMAKCPGFFVDCPFQPTPKEEAYLRTELEEMIRFLETQTGAKLDPEALSRHIAEADRQLVLYREINELRRRIPSPFSAPDFLKLFTVDCLFAGEPEATAYLEALKTEMQAKVQATGTGTAREKHRLMSLLMPTILHLNAIETVCREHGAVSVVDPLFCSWFEGRLDPARPLESLMTKIRLNPVMAMHGPLDGSLEEKIIDLAQRYEVDGAIYYAHVGCRQSAALIRLIKEALNRVGVPVLVLDCDIVDATVTPEDETRRKLGQFFELLEER